MTPHRVGRWSLRLDGIYCLVVGVLLVAVAPIWADAVGLGTPIVRVGGVAVLGWALALLHVSTRSELRGWLRLVLAANVLAAASIAVSASFVDGAVATIALLAIAVDVAAFAVSQAASLRPAER
ncbi:MAG: hypothetical protein ACYC2O_06595 [Microthrixaceae bacterium]